MPRRLPGSAAALALLLAACASNYTADYQARLLGQLPDRRNVTFTESQTYPGDVLCGRYTSLTGNGFSLVTRDYVVTPEVVLRQASELDKRVYCTEEPAATLFELRGIGGEAVDWPALAKIRDDMLAIDAAIHRYHSSVHALPRQLAGLVEGDFGVGQDQLVDPWGRPYRYTPGLSGRTTPQYELSTAGADGQAGGRGMDADISRDERFLLTHLLRVEGYER